MVDVILPPLSPLGQHFLVDTGADRTVLSRATLDAFGLDTVPPATGVLAGVGGQSGIVSLDIKIELPIEGGATATINGPFSAFLDPNALDIDVLGRDVLNHFEVIVSRKKKEVLLLAPPHGYQVTGP